MRLCYCLIFLFFTITVKAQSSDSLFRALSSKLALSDTAVHSDLFLHFDKNIYSADENVWFAAYLINTSKVQAHHTLYITLLNEMEHSVVSSYQFVLDGGLASGSFSLPDSLLSGRYCLVAYTNKSIQESKSYLFRQPIEILGLRKDPFTLQFTGTDQGTSILFTGRIAKRDGSSAVMPNKLSFTIIADGKQYEKMQSGISSSGEFQFKLPAALALKPLEITGRLGQGKEQMAFKRLLTWSSAKNLIEFFAPFGRLLAGQTAQVAISARNSSGRAISRSCVLLENGTEITAFGTDRRGSGLFTFTPKAGKQYLMKFKGDNEIPIQNFPVIITNTWSIRPVNTIVNDILELHITTPDSAGECLIAIHNNRSMLYGVHVRLPQPETSLKVPVAGWEPGIAYVCLYTKDGTLRERRLVLIKSPDRLNAVLQTDSATYRPLSKVTVKLKLTDSKGEPVKGVFSFSSALEQALTVEAKNIEVFNLFERFLPDRILLPPASFLTNEQSIRSVLLRQENIAADSSLTSIGGSKPGNYDGYVLHYDKKPKKLVDLMLFGSQTAMFQSDNEGKFILPYLLLRADAGKKVMLSVVGKNPLGYKIELTSPRAKINAALADQNLVHSYVVPDELSNEQKQMLASSRNILLKEVLITAKKADSGNYYGKANSSGVCNDYVCQFDVLNCPYHNGVKSPEEGHRYNFESPSGIRQVIYHCAYSTKPSYIREVPATLTYVPYTPFNPLEQNMPEAMNNTTLHWQAFIQTDEKGEAVISFYNNARNGRFKAVVQGVTSKDIFSSEVSFEVRR